MNVLKRISVLFFILCRMALYTTAQEVMSFKQLSLDQGTSSVWIFDIAEDSLGFIWLAGHDGLDRYDGSRFQSFIHEPNNNQTISENQVFRLLVSSQNELFLSTLGGGINRLNINNGELAIFPQVAINEQNGFWPYISDIIQLEGDNFLGLETRSSSIVAFDREGKVINRQGVYFNLNHQPHREYHTRNLIPSPTNSNLVYFFGYNGIYKYDRSSCVIYEQSHWLSAFKDVTSEHVEITYMVFMDNDHLLLATKDGYFIKLSVIHDRIEWVKSLPYDPQTFRLIPARKGGFWVLGNTSLLYHFNVSEETFKKVNINLRGLTNVKFTSLYEAKDGAIWIGTYNHGALYHSASENQFSYTSRYGLSQDFPHRHNIYLSSIIAPLSNTSYTTLDHAPYFIKTDLTNGESSRVNLPDELQRPPYTLHYWDHHSILFHDGAKIYNLDIKTEKTKQFTDHPVAEYASSNGLGIKQIFTDTSKNIVLECSDKWVMNIPFTNEILTIPKNALPIKDGRQTNAYHKNGYTYILTHYDLIRIHHDSKAIDLIPLDIPKVISSDFSFRTIDIFRDTFYIGCAIKGMYKFMWIDDKFTFIDHLHTGNVLRSNNIQLSVIRQDSIMWLGTSLGIELLNLSKGTSVSFGNKENLPFLLIDRAMHFNKNNFLITNTDDFIIWANEEQLTQTTQKNLYLSSFKMKDHEIVNGAFWPDSLPIRLHYNENFFKIELSSPGITGAVYAVRMKLEGFDTDWHELGNLYESNYTNVPHGEYLLKAELVNRLDKNLLQALTIPIIIKAPYWKTTWFIALIVILLNGLLLLFYKLRVGAIKREEKIKTAYNKRIAEIEMQSLRSQMNPHFMFNSLNSIKHYIMKNEREKASEYLSNFASLIRSILNYSDTKFITLEDELRTLGIYIELEQLRFPRSFDYKLYIDEHLDTSEILVQPLLFQPFVENAIWHGLMHKEKDRRLQIECILKSNRLVCTIEDNGIGREKAAQIKSKSAAKKSYGLNITEARIKAQDPGTQIRIEDLYDDQKEPIGTRVTIELPIKYLNESKPIPS